MNYKKEKRRADKLLLQTEILLGVFGIALFFISIFSVIFMPMHPAVAGAIVAAGVICFIATVVYAIRIEQIAGYYECPRCESRYVPKYQSVLFAPHFGRTRRMKCEHCGRIGWHEKVLDLEVEGREEK